MNSYNRWWVVASAAMVGILAGACGVTDPATDDQDSVDLEDQTASALGSSDEGPFTNIPALASYWSSTPTGALTQIYVNGGKIFERSGFGPAFVKQYFDCRDADIYAVCPSGFLDGFTNLNTLVSRSPAAAAIYLDGTLIRQGTNSVVVGISTCQGAQSYYGPVKYYKVTSYNNGFIPYSSSCYP